MLKKALIAAAALAPTQAYSQEWQAAPAPRYFYYHRGRFYNTRYQIQPTPASTSIPFPTTPAVVSTSRPLKWWELHVDYPDDTTAGDPKSSWWQRPYSETHKP